MATNTGVFPVFDNVFKIGTEGRSSAAEKMVTIAEMESFSVSIDGNVEEWKPMESEGWTKRMTTGKALTISLSGQSFAPAIPGKRLYRGAGMEIRHRLRYQVRVGFPGRF